MVAIERIFHDFFSELECIHMPFAIEFLLDQEKSERVRHVWQDMADHKYGVEIEGRPHITLAVWETVDLDIARTWLEAYAALQPPIPVRFASTGFFANELAVVFLAAIATPYLLELQTTFCRDFAGPDGDSWVNYREDWWVPHCTLAMGVENDVFPQAMQVAKQIGLPCAGVLEAVTIVEIPALIDHGTWPLTGPPRASSF